MNITKSIIFISALLISITAAAQEKTWGIGFRFGEPLGLTIKKYGGNNMFELSVGRSSLWGNTNYKYDNSFYASYNRDNYEYRGFGAYNPLALQFHILRRKMFASAPGLSFYYGIGPQLRYGSIEYDYRQKIFTTGNNYYWDYGHVSLSRFDVGFDGVLGLEYTISDIPLTFFVDLTMDMELYSSPFYFWTEGGLGVRYNF